MEGCQAPVRVVRNPTVRIESPKATLGICILRSSLFSLQTLPITRAWNKIKQTKVKEE